MASVLEKSSESVSSTRELDGHPVGARCVCVTQRREARDVSVAQLASALDLKDIIWSISKTEHDWQINQK